MFTRRQFIAAIAAAGASHPAFDLRADTNRDTTPVREPTWRSLPPTPKLPDTARKGLADVNGTKIFFAQFGAGPNVLFLHGGLANSNYWGHQVATLSQNHTVTVMDTRGHGRSPVTSSKFGYSIFADDAATLLKTLNIQRSALIGWSDGAITGLQLAMSRPDLVERLFAFGANSSSRGLKPHGSKSEVFAEFQNRCKIEYAAMSPAPEKWPILLEGLRTMWRIEPNFTDEQLNSVKGPTTISDGEYDEIISREHTERLALAVKAERLVIQPDVSHFAMLQNPSQFDRALIEFLS